MLKQIMIKPIFKGQSIGFLSLSATAALLCIFVLSLLIKIAFSGDDLTRIALENGQRVVVHLKNSAVDGKPRNNAIVQTERAKTVIDASVNQAASKEGLNPVPGENLVEQTEKGLLPIANPDGTLPWKYYARPFTEKDKRPIIAIVFTDLALSRSLTGEVLKLPHNFTLGFSPYAGDMAKWALKGRSEGFESVVDFPIQTDNYPLSDPGTFGLLEESTPDE